MICRGAQCAAVSKLKLKAIVNVGGDAYIAPLINNAILRADDIRPYNGFSSNIKEK